MDCLSAVEVYRNTRLGLELSAQERHSVEGLEVPVASFGQL